MTLRSITISLTDFFMFTTTTTIFNPLYFFFIDYCCYLELYSDGVHAASGERTRKLAMVFKKHNFTILYGVWTDHMVQSSAAPNTREAVGFSKDGCDLARGLVCGVNRKCFRLISRQSPTPSPRIARRAHIAPWHGKWALSFQRFRFDHGLVH